MADCQVINLLHLVTVDVECAIEHLAKSNPAFAKKSLAQQFEHMLRMVDTLKEKAGDCLSLTIEEKIDRNLTSYAIQLHTEHPEMFGIGPDSQVVALPSEALTQEDLEVTLESPTKTWKVRPEDVNEGIPNAILFFLLREVIAKREEVEVHRVAMSVMNNGVLEKVIVARDCQHYMSLDAEEKIQGIAPGEYGGKVFYQVTDRTNEEDMTEIENHFAELQV